MGKSWGGAGLVEGEMGDTHLLLDNVVFELLEAMPYKIGLEMQICMSQLRLGFYLFYQVEGAEQTKAC
jgi:hypothetical protein